jgi:hypothetical protein
LPSYLAKKGRFWGEKMLSWNAHQISVFASEMRVGALWLAFACSRPCKLIHLQNTVDLRGVKTRLLGAKKRALPARKIFL